jgi:cytoskeletal protein RodZ
MSEQGRADIGKTLREARERAGLSLRQIADTTKLSVHVLSALEGNRISKLPGGIYRRAIVRAFAREVGVDVEQTLRQFLEQYPDDVPSASAVRPLTSPTPPRRLLRGAVSALGAAIPILAGIYYFTTTASNSRQQHGTVSRRAERPAASRGGEVDPTRVARPAGDRSVVTMTVTARPLDAGEEIRLEFSTDVVVNGDNAGVVRLRLNGHDTQVLGASGAPLNIRIPREGYQDWLRQR